MDSKSLAQTFDQSILRPEAISKEEIIRISKEAIQYGFRGIVVHPYNVSLVKDLLKGSNVLTVSVCDFPHGKGLTKSRVKDIKEILKLGVDEVDIVANYQLIQEENTRDLKKDLKAVAKAMEGKVLKIILEVDLLTEKSIRHATRTIAKIVSEEDANIVIKTKTGFSENKLPNLTAVKIIKEILEEINLYGKIKIKASGGIKTKEEAFQLLETGAHILGVSKGKELIS